MKANELMVGDWVFIDHCSNRLEPCYGQVTGIDKNGEDVYTTDGMVDISLIKPIPLTHELLERNGFKKYNFHDIVVQHQWSWWLDTLTSVSLWCRELNDDPKDGWMIRIESPLVSCCHKVEYVHELQQTLRTCKIDKEITFNED